MKNPHPRMVVDEISGKEVINPKYLTFLVARLIGYEDGSMDAGDISIQQAYEAGLDTGRKEGYKSGQDDLTQSFSGFIDERLIVLEAIPAMSDGIKIKIEELTWAKKHLARIAKEMTE